MDKTIFETYEFVSTDNDQNETEQVYVVNNDGTLLLNRPVQFVTDRQQLKDVGNNTQTCAIYDVASQQYYVENSSQLISVTDQYVLPQESNTDIYANNYLYEAESSTVKVPTVECLTGEADQSTKMEIEEIPDSEFINTANMTEITLSDEQYRLMEEKGWVILQSNNKLFLLNSMGLHEITGNDKLIDQLQNDGGKDPEITLIENEEAVCQVTPAAISEQTETTNEESSKTEYVSLQTNTVNDVKLTEAVDLNNGKKTSNSPKSLLKSNESTDVKQFKTYSSSHKIENSKITKNQTVLRLNSKFLLKDIRKSIVLGKTSNGKNLVAKVMSVKNAPLENAIISEKKTLTEDKVKAFKIKTQQYGNYNRMLEIDKLIEGVTKGTIKQTPSEEDIQSAKAILKQLFNVKATRSPMVNRYIVLSKIVKSMANADSVISETEPVLVTGKMTVENSDGHFTHLPNLLQNLRTSTLESLKSDTSISKDYILHAHVLETRHDDKPTQTAITFSKRKFPLNITRTFEPKRIFRYKEAVHACCACAAVFRTEKELVLHREKKCDELEEERPPLVIDTEETNSPNKSITLSKQDTVVCVHCKAKVKLKSYQRHLKSHFGPNGPTANGTDEKSQHKCKMCASTFFHASSLSKHILKQHIKSNLLIKNS